MTKRLSAKSLNRDSATKERRHPLPASLLSAMAAIAVLVLLALVFNRQVLGSLDSRLDHAGDPLLNSWILSWNLRSLTQEPGNIWHANIFYPHRYTLAHSENLIATSVMLLPVHVFSKNPVLLYNVAYLAGFILSALAAWLLGYHLTGSHLIGMIAGVAFALCPFRLAHSGHLQIQHGQWIPLAFLFMLLYSRRLEAGKGRGWLFLAGVSFAMLCQFLSNTYYFMFLAPTFALFQALWIWNLEPARRRAAFRDLAGSWTATGLVLLPFARPYMIVRSNHALARLPDDVARYGASLQHYLAYNRGNVLFGKLTSPLNGVEFCLAPGIVILVLATLPACVHIVRAFMQPRATAGRIATYLSGRKTVVVTDLLIALTALLLTAILCGTGIDTTLGGGQAGPPGMRITATNVGRPFLVLLALLVVRAYLAGFSWKDLCRVRFGIRTVFAILSVFSILMSIGPDGGLYDLFYRWVPGYDGLRVPARFGVMTTFSLGVLAMLNLSSLLARFGSARKRAALCLLILAAVCGEYWSRPRKMTFKPRPREVYAWLRDAPEGAMIELPMGRSSTDVLRDIRYVFNSTQHWKPMFNGYSGYFPPDYHRLRTQFSTFPSRESLALLSRLGIKYVLVHRCTDRKVEAYKEHVDLVARFNNDCVFMVPGEQ